LGSSSSCCHRYCCTAAAAAVIIAAAAAAAAVVVFVAAAAAVVIAAAAAAAAVVVDAAVIVVVVVVGKGADKWRVVSCACNLHHWNAAALLRALLFEGIDGRDDAFDRGLLHDVGNLEPHEIKRKKET
jgi:hypothetical protein